MKQDAHKLKQYAIKLAWMVLKFFLTKNKPIKMKNLMFLFIVLPFTCSEPEEMRISGTWEGIIEMTDSIAIYEIPITIEIETNQYTVTGAGYYGDYNRYNRFEISGYTKGDLLYMSFVDLVCFNEMTALKIGEDLVGHFTSTNQLRVRKGEFTLKPQK